MPDFDARTATARAIGVGGVGALNGDSDTRPSFWYSGTITQRRRCHV